MEVLWNKMKSKSKNYILAKFHFEKITKIQNIKKNFNRFLLNLYLGGNN